MLMQKIKKFCLLVHCSIFPVPGHLTFLVYFTCKFGNIIQLFSCFLILMWGKSVNHTVLDKEYHRCVPLWYFLSCWRSRKQCWGPKGCIVFSAIWAFCWGATRKAWSCPAAQKEGGISQQADFTKNQTPWRGKYCVCSKEENIDKSGWSQTFCHPANTCKLYSPPAICHAEHWFLWMSCLHCPWIVRTGCVLGGS